VDKLKVLQYRILYIYATNSALCTDKSSVKLSTHYCGTQTPVLVAIFTFT